LGRISFNTFPHSGFEKMLARKAVFIVLKEAIAGLLGFLTLFFVARYMGAEPLGLASFGLAFVNIFNIIADMGFNGAHVKRVSESKEEEHVGKCIAVYIRFKLILTLASLAILFASLALLNFLKLRFYDATYPEIIYLLIAYFLFSQILGIPKFTFDAKLKIYRSQIATLAGAVGKDVLIISGAIIMTLGPYTMLQKGIMLGCGYVIEVFITAIILYFFFLREEKIGRYDKEIAKSYLNFALPFFPVAVFSMLAVSADRLTIGYFRNAKEVGLYSAVQQVANALIILQSAVTAVLFPAISSEHKLGNLGEVRRLTKEAERYIFLILIPIGFAIMVFSKEIIHVFLSDEFLVASYCFIFLTWYYILFSLANMAGTTISGADKPKIGAGITLASSLSNIFLNFLFVPFHGATGAAIATLISGIIYFILAIYFSKKVLGVWVLSPSLLKIFIAGLLTALCFYSLKQIAFPVPTEMRLYFLIPLFFGFACLYLAILHLFREFGRNEIKFFKRSLHLGEMAKGISEELRRKEG